MLKRACPHCGGTIRLGVNHVPWRDIGVRLCPHCNQLVHERQVDLNIVMGVIGVCLLIGAVLLARAGADPLLVLLAVLASAGFIGAVHYATRNVPAFRAANEAEVAAWVQGARGPTGRRGITLGLLTALVALIALVYLSR